MECDKIQEQLSAYLDNALSPAEKGVIDNHLRSCPKCRKALADLEMTISSIKGLDEIIPPAWLTQKVMTSVKADAGCKKRNLLQKLFYPLHIKLPIEAFGMLLVALTALYVFKSMEPGLKPGTTPSEETVSEYAKEGKVRKLRPEIKKQSEPPGERSSKKDETTAGSPSQKEGVQPPARLSKQSIYDKEPPVKEKDSGELNAPEKNMLGRSAPSPAGLSERDELRPEHAPQAAGKIISIRSEKEDISLSFKTGDIGSAKRELEEVLSDLGGKVVREEPPSDTLIIIGELGSDMLLPFMKKLKTLGYIKEKTPTPMSDKDRVLIRITVSAH